MTNGNVHSHEKKHFGESASFPRHFLSVNQSLSRVETIRRPTIRSTLRLSGSRTVAIADCHQTEKALKAFRNKKMASLSPAFRFVMRVAS
jgi:hypothetical protein|tara:strand:- start:938 stop:1207 length:270 start_codon:yes stop_codon:yes gene_type:complete